MPLLQKAAVSVSLLREAEDAGDPVQGPGASDQHGVVAVYSGSTDIGLSEAGKAVLLQRKKETACPDISGMRILTSGMQRCEETLTLLYGDVPHETDAAFREMDFGAFERRSYEELKDDPTYQAWIAGNNEANVAPGGESGALMTARVIAGLDRLLTDDRDTLLVTHGGVIAAIMAHLFPSEHKNRYEWQPAPGGGYVIELHQESYRLF